MLTLADVKLYLRIDSDTEDSELTRLMAVADAYIKNAIGVERYTAQYGNADDFTAAADQAKLALLAEMFENRNNERQGDYSQVTRSLINQLVYTEA